jgi:hypothetical protein
MRRGDAPTPLSAASRRAVNAILPAIPLAPLSELVPDLPDKDQRTRVSAALRAPADAARPSRVSEIVIRFGSRSRIYR